MSAPAARTAARDADPARRRLRLTREGAAAAGIAGCFLLSSFIQQVNLLVLMAALVAAALLVGAWSARRNLTRLKLARRLPAEVFADMPFEVDLELSNGRRWSAALGVQAEDRLAPPLPGFAPVVAFPATAPRLPTRARYRAVVHVRGVYRFGQATLATRYPFGLVEARAAAAGPQDLVVFPRLGRLLPAARAMADHVQQDSRRLRHVVASQEQMHGLREYRDGDNSRHIHWRTTARRGELMVKEFESGETQDTLLALELWEPPKPDAASRAALELAVSFAASMCVELCRRAGTRVALGLAGAEWSAHHGVGSPRLLADLLRRLAEAGGSPQADLPNHANELAMLAPPGAHVWLVGARPWLGRAGRLAEELGLGRGRAVFQALDAASGDLAPLFCWEPAG